MPSHSDNEIDCFLPFIRFLRVFRRRVNAFHENGYDWGGNWKKRVRKEGFETNAWKFYIAGYTTIFYSFYFFLKKKDTWNNL